MEVSVILTIIFMSIGIIGCICMLDKHIKIKEKEEIKNSITSGMNLRKIGKI